MGSEHGTYPLTDRELLDIAVAISLDGRRRLAGTRGITIAATRDGQDLFVGDGIPNTLVAALVDAVAASPRAATPDTEPPALSACRVILEGCCAPLSLDAGPYYLIGPEVRMEMRTQIVRSDASTTEQPRRLNPGNWDHEEWNELLDGALGPWAMAIVDGRVISLCHTPGRMTERAAECGVWTDFDYRGRGHAAEVTAAWADILRPSGRHLFYSTDAGNISSQRVAARLRLRPLGWTWRLAKADAGRRDRRHPLSRRFS